MTIFLPLSFFVVAVVASKKEATEFHGDVVVVENIVFLSISISFQTDSLRSYDMILTLLAAGINGRRQPALTLIHHNHHQFIYLDEWVISDKTHYNIVINFPFAASAQTMCQNVRFTSPFSLTGSLTRFSLLKIHNEMSLTTAIIGFQSISQSSRTTKKNATTSSFSVRCHANRASLMQNSQ